MTPSATQDVVSAVEALDGALKRKAPAEQVAPLVDSLVAKIGVVLTALETASD